MAHLGAERVTCRNILVSTDSLPGCMMTDYLTYVQQLGCAQQPEPGPLLPAALSYGKGLSSEFISSHISEKPHPKAYINQTPYWQSLTE